MHHWGGWTPVLPNVCGLSVDTQKQQNIFLLNAI